MLCRSGWTTHKGDAVSVAPNFRSLRGLPKWIPILFLVMILCVLLLLVSCSKPSQDTPVSGPPTTQEPINMEEMAASKQGMPPAPTTTVTTLPPSTTTTTVALPPPTTPPTTSPPPPPPSSAPAAGGDVWWELAGCETGYKYDNPNTGNGYYGYFQFDYDTWQSVGGPGYPHHHSYDTQLIYAKKLQAQRGWSPWPYCSQKLREKGYIQ